MIARYRTLTYFLPVYRSVPCDGLSGTNPVMPAMSGLRQLRAVGCPPRTKLPLSEMRRSFGNARDYAHEKPSAVLHLKTTQKFQGRDNDRDRPRGHLEPLLPAQRRRR